MSKYNKCSAAALLSLAVLSGGLETARAGQFEALCGGAKCSILVTPDEIVSPYGTLPTSRVTYWGNTGESKTSVGTGVATTILLGGIGLLGFLAKNHEYNYYINGYDASGRKVAMQFVFKNDKPAKVMMQELTAYTGLGMGQTRSVDDIKAAEKGKQVTPGPTAQSEPKLGPMPGPAR
ncbi:MAG: hypothetical protein VKP70_05185 [Cyanobacteriota bacterium]|nr:hypothetical protein [Cyanobacteriota bacterium]